MKNVLLVICILSSFTVLAQDTGKDYNQKLADSLGADEYGMKEYVLVILKTGTAKITDKALRDSLMMGHMTNMGTMAKAGQLIVAGPLGENDKNYRGIFIFNVKTIEDAKKIAQTDPAIKAGIFDVELIPWYGSAALPMYLNEVKKVQKKSIID